MKKRTSILVTICLIGVIIILSLLVYLTPLPNQRNNGFSRQWLSDAIKPLNHSTTELPISRISGASKEHVFLSGTDPRWILMMDKMLYTKDTLQFAIQGNDQLLSSIDISVDSPNVYIYAKNISYIISSKVHAYQVDTQRLHTPLFTRAARVSEKLLIIRGLDSTQLNQVFKRIDCSTGKVLSETPIIENQHDGGFSADGYLKYDTLTNKLLYVQTFKNRFFCLDTNLNLIYTAKTIDTSYTGDTKVEVVKDGALTKLMPSSARTIVNLDCFTNNGFLYISSGLRADNESIVTFNKSTTLDVYKIETGQYIGSFRINNPKNKRAMSMIASDKLLVILYKGGNIATYELNAPNSNSSSKIATLH